MKEFNHNSLPHSWFPSMDGMGISRRNDQERYMNKRKSAHRMRPIRETNAWSRMDLAWCPFLCKCHRRDTRKDKGICDGVFEQNSPQGFKSPVSSCESEQHVWLRLHALHEQSRLHFGFSRRNHESGNHYRSRCSVPSGFPDPDQT